MPIYVSSGGTLQELTECACSTGGQLDSIAKMYVSTGSALSEIFGGVRDVRNAYDLPLGSTLCYPGAPDTIIIEQNFDTGLGERGIQVIAKDAVGYRKFSISASLRKWQLIDLKKYANAEYYSGLPTAFQGLLLSTKSDFVSTGNHMMGYRILSTDKIYLLRPSDYEEGKYMGNRTNRLVSTEYWIMDVLASTDEATGLNDSDCFRFIATNGNIENLRITPRNINIVKGFRPVMTLRNDVKCYASPNPDGSYSLISSTQKER